MVKKPFREGQHWCTPMGVCVCMCVCAHACMIMKTKRMQIKTQSNGYRFYRKKMRKERKNSETNQLRKREGEWDGL